MKYSVLVALVLTVVPLWSRATTGIVKGAVEFVRVHDTAISGPGWTPPRFWFTLNGAGPLGACPAWIGGRILLVSETKEAYLAVLSAYMTGKEIAVYWDDAQQVNGLCRAGYITIGNPPPTF